MNRPLLAVSRALGAVALGCAALSAQSFRDLVESRNATQPYSSIFQVELGAIGANAEDPAEVIHGLRMAKDNF